MPLFKKKKNHPSGTAFDGPPTLPAFIPVSRRSLSLPALRARYGSQQEAQDSGDGQGQGGSGSLDLDLDLDLRDGLYDDGDGDGDGDVTPRHSASHGRSYSQRTTAATTAANDGPAYGHRTRVIVHGQDTWDIIEPAPARSSSRANGHAYSAQRRPDSGTNSSTATSRAPLRRSTLPTNQPLGPPHQQQPSNFRVSPVLSLMGAGPQSGLPAAAQKIDIARRQTLRRSKGPTRLNVMLLGEAFTGKTSFVRALTESLGLGDGGRGNEDDVDVVWSAEARAQAESFGLRRRGQGLRRTRSMQTLDDVELVPSTELLLRGVVDGDEANAHLKRSQDADADTATSPSTTRHSPQRPRSRRASFASTYLSLGPAAPPQRLLLSLMDTPSLPCSAGDITPAHVSAAPSNPSAPPPHLAPLLSEITERYAHTLREETKLNRVPVKSGQVAGRHVNVVLWFIEPREVLEGAWWYAQREQLRLEKQWRRVQRRREWGDAEAGAGKATKSARAKKSSAANGSAKEKKKKKNRLRKTDSQGTLRALATSSAEATSSNGSATQQPSEPQTRPGQVYQHAQSPAHTHDRAASIQSLVENLQLETDKDKANKTPSVHNGSTSLSRQASTSSHVSAREGQQPRVDAEAEGQHDGEAGTETPKADKKGNPGQGPSQDESGAVNEQIHQEQLEEADESQAPHPRPSSEASDVPASSTGGPPSSQPESEPAPEPERESSSESESESDAASSSSSSSSSSSYASDTASDSDSEEEPYTPTLPPSSRVLLAHLLPLVPVIPIVARADTLSARDLSRVRAGVGRGWADVVRSLRAERRRQRGESQADADAGAGTVQEEEEGEEEEDEEEGEFGWEWMGRKPQPVRGKGSRAEGRPRGRKTAVLERGNGAAPSASASAADEPVKVVRLKSRGQDRQPLFYKFGKDGGADGDAGGAPSGKPPWSSSSAADGQSRVFHSDSESSSEGEGEGDVRRTPSDADADADSGSDSSDSNHKGDDTDGHSSSSSYDDGDSDAELDPTDPRYILGVQHIVPSGAALRRRWPLAIFAPEVESLRFRGGGGGGGDEKGGRSSSLKGKGKSKSKSKSSSAIAEKTPSHHRQPHLSRRYALVRVPPSSSSFGGHGNSRRHHHGGRRAHAHTHTHVLSPAQSDFPLLRALLLGTHTGRILEASRGRFEDWRVGVLDGRGGGGGGREAAGGASARGAAGGAGARQGRAAARRLERSDGRLDALLE